MFIDFYGFHVGKYSSSMDPMGMERPPFEDVFPIEHGDFPSNRHVSF